LERAGFLVPNVVRFEVAWWVQYPGQENLVRLGPEYEVLLNNVLSIDGTPYPGATLEAADITLTILGEEGMQQVQTLEASGSLDEDRLSELIRLYGRVHTTRVKINY
jgi:hypothetical protein